MAIGTRVMPEEKHKKREEYPKLELALGLYGAVVKE